MRRERRLILGHESLGRDLDPGPANALEARQLDDIEVVARVAEV